jgi:hypothetical protein
MPELTFDALDTIPEGLREVAVQKDGKFVVDVVPGKKLAEFRDNNINLAKERDTLKARWEAVAPLVGEDLDGFKTSYEALKAVDQQVKDGKLTARGDIETEVTRRVDAMKANYENRLQAEGAARAAAEAKAAEADGRFRKSIVDRYVTDAVLNEKSGAIATALPDIIERASKVFKVGDDGKLIAKEGDAVIYGADGATPMTPLEWLGKLKEQAPYFFKGSNGGGAAGGQTTNAPGGLSQGDFLKLPAAERLKLARKAGVA